VPFNKGDGARLQQWRNVSEWMSVVATQRAALGVFVFIVAGKTIMLSRREARAADIPFRRRRSTARRAWDVIRDIRWEQIRASARRGQSFHCRWFAVS
jgi:hypothetical protein